MIQYHIHLQIHLHVCVHGDDDVTDKFAETISEDKRRY